MNKSDLIARMTERLNGDRATAVAAVNGVLEEIEGSVARGERVSLTGFGTFERRERASRVGRNPRTGETIQVGPSVVPAFRAGTGFRTLLSQGVGESTPAGPRAGEAGVPGDGESRSASSTAAATATADVPAGKKKAGRKARAQAEEKSAKAARKADKDKGKKAKSSR